MKQTEIIKQHLEKHGHITGREAYEKYGIYRLSEVIRKLRCKGLNIVTYDREFTDCDGDKRRYGEYVLKRESNEQ